MAYFTIEQGWGYKKLRGTQVLHNNPKTIARMYFDVLHSKGYDSFSWKLTNRRYLINMYINILNVRGINNYQDFLNRPKRYDAEYNTKRRK